MSAAGNDAREALDARLVAWQRAALERISSIENRTTGGDWDEIEEARQIARAAIDAAMASTQGAKP